MIDHQSTLRVPQEERSEPGPARDIGGLQHFSSQPARSALHSVEDLDEPLIRREQCRTLANARVVWANYDAIRQDFAGVDFGASSSSGKAATPISNEPDIDAWLLDHAAIISEAQLQSLNANEEIPVLGPGRIAYRPPGYGRALVIQLIDGWSDCGFLKSNFSSQGLLDVKGCGVATGQIPTLRLHRSGLLELSSSLCELLSQLIIDRVFYSLGLDVRGVALYAILDLGFRIRSDDGFLVPAGAIVRRAHRRPIGNLQWPDFGCERHKAKLTIEFILRRFGISSCAPNARLRIWREEKDMRASIHGVLEKLEPENLEKLLHSINLEAPAEFDLVNVQLARGATATPLSAELVDFGQYRIGNQFFVTPLATLVRNRPLNWGGYSDRNSPCWVQPNPRISVDQEVMKMRAVPADLHQWLGGASPSELTPLSTIALETTRDLSLGRISRLDLEKRLLSFVHSATKNFAQCQGGVEVTSEGQPELALNDKTIQPELPACISDVPALVNGFLAENRRGLNL